MGIVGTIDKQTPDAGQWLGRAVVAAGFAVMLAGCNVKQLDMAYTTPPDYRERHPIAIKEGARTVEVLVGSRRGGLNPTQRADVLAFAHSWRREATGGIVVEAPVGTPNDTASREAMHEIRSILTAASVPPHALALRSYQPTDPTRFPSIRMNYPLVKATTHNCDRIWPDDVGPTYDKLHNQNVEYWAFGCATQRNLAAMVADPTDLVQPRSGSPTYTARRTFALDKYRQGQSTATTYTDEQKGKISELGQ